MYKPHSTSITATKTEKIENPRKSMYLIEIKTRSRKLRKQTDFYKEPPAPLPSKKKNLSDMDETNGIEYNKISNSIIITDIFREVFSRS